MLDKVDQKLQQPHASSTSSFWSANRMTSSLHPATINGQSATGPLHHSATAPLHHSASAPVLPGQRQHIRYGLDSTQGTSGTQFLGVSPPIALVPADELDLRLTDELEQCLRSYNLFESEEDMSKRMDVLGKINLLVKQWVREVSIQKVKRFAFEFFSGGCGG